MSEQPRPFVGKDKGYPLAPTSTGRMEDLSKVKLRAPCVGEQERQRVAQNWGFDSVDDALEGFGFDQGDILSPPRFYETVATVIFRGIDQSDIEQGQIDFAEVRRGLADFTQAGNEEAMELLNGLKGMNDSLTA